MGLNLTGQTIQSTYEGLVQISGSNQLTDGTGSVITSIVVTSSYADTATSASYATTASYALNVPVTASYAISASHANNADSSQTSVSASYATYATTAGSAGSATTAISASHAVNADLAITASYALDSAPQVSASYATSASHAVASDTSISASYATYATSASHAVSADSALTATSSSHAITSDTSISASYAVTASYAENVTPIDTGSFMITGSVAGTTLTFEKGDGSTFDLVVATTGSAAESLVTASISDATITFTKGDTSTFDIVVNNVSNAISSSHSIYSDTAGSAATATSASHAINADTASLATIATTAISSSHAVNADIAISASYALTASYLEGGVTTPTLQQVTTAGSTTTDYITVSGVVGTYLTATSGALSVNSLGGDVDIQATNDVKLQSIIYPNSDGTAGQVITTDGAATLSFTSTVPSASYSVTASYALNGGGGGATFPYTGSAIISGSLTVIGDATHISGSLSGSFIDNIGTPTASLGINHIVSLTQAEYDALSPDVNTYYVITDSTLSTFTNISASGWVSASYFVGDGSQLTNIPASDPFPYTGSAIISGSLFVDGNLSSGGTLHTITGGSSAAVGGEDNDVPGNRSAIIGGYQNTVSGDDAVIIGGYGGSTTALRSAVIAGQSNTVSNTYSVVVGGIGLSTTKDSEVVVKHLTVKGTGVGNVTAISDSGGVTAMDCGVGNFFTLAMPAGGTTTLTPSNIESGQTISLRVTQNATSSSLAYAATIDFTGGAPFTVSTGSGEVDVMTFISFNGTTLQATGLSNFY